MVFTTIICKYSNINNVMFNYKNNEYVFVTIILLKFRILTTTRFFRFESLNFEIVFQITETKKKKLFKIFHSSLNV